MAYTEALCDRLRFALKNVAQANAGELVRDASGFVDALSSPLNTVGFEQIQVGTGGKNFGARVTYLQRAEKGEATAAANTLCSATEEPDPKEDLVNIDQVVSITKKLDEDEIAKLCESRDEHAAQFLMSLFNGVNAKLNEDLLTLQAAAFGNYADGTSVVHPFEMLNSDGTPKYLGYSQLQSEIRKVRGTGRPMIIGSGNFELYSDQVSIGCCNDGGIDLSQAGNKYAWFYDVDTETILGANELVVMLPGAAQIVTFNKHMGDRRRTVEGVYDKTTVIDPFTGIEWDYYLRYDECTDEWQLALELNYTLFNLPANMFKAGSPLDGVNYTLRASATQAP